jgi:tripartite-type tricarboxylate transporter receptor subunit TctC
MMPADAENRRQAQKQGAVRMRPINAMLVGLAAVTFGASPPVADEIADFYKGKSINWILSAGAGGGYASYAHTFAPFFSKHIPGNPNIVIQNMPGAGGIRAMTFFNTVAPKDGTTIGLVHSSVPFAPLYGIKGASFDAREFRWIGSITSAFGICVSWSASGITKWEDMFEREFLVGGTGAGSQMETLPAMLKQLFGANIRIISGYKGGNDVYIAMERGEVHGRCGGLVSSIKSTRPDWFPKKLISVPIQIALQRDEDFPDVPAVVEFVKDERTRKVLELILSPFQMDRPILLPPGAPDDKLAALRKAFIATMRDPAFHKEAEKQRIEIKEISGERVAAVIDRAYSMEADVIQAAKSIMNLTGSGGSGGGGSKKKK